MWFDDLTVPPLLSSTKMRSPYGLPPLVSRQQLFPHRLGLGQNGPRVWTADNSTGSLQWSP
ncbi:MAG: hypothetical protein AAGE59_16650 [Cyanobacteria bacterium P01_F01_bin.86]